MTRLALLVELKGWLDRLGAEPFLPFPTVADSPTTAEQRV